MEVGQSDPSGNRKELITLVQYEPKSSRMISVGQRGAAAVYTLEFDERSRRLTQRASGFWDLEEFVRYQAEFTTLVTRLREDGRPITMLFDSRDMPRQSAEIVSAFSKMTEAKIMNPNGRVAVLVSGMLSKLQTQRIAHDPLIQSFTDEGEAKAWLAEPV